MPRDQVLRVHASSGTTGKPTVVGYSRRDLDTWADVMARSMRAGRLPARHAGAEFLRLRPVHRRNRLSLRRRAAGHDGRAGVGRHDRAAGATDRDFKPDIIFVTPSYLLAILDEFRAQGVDPRQSLAQDRDVRRRTLDQCHARRKSRTRSTCTPSTITAFRKSSARACPANASRARTAAHLGGSFLSGGDRSGDRQGAAGWRGRRAGVHHADQGGDAGHALSHARPVAACCRARRARCAAWRR